MKTELKNPRIQFSPSLLDIISIENSKVNNITHVILKCSLRFLLFLSTFSKLLLCQDILEITDIRYPCRESKSELVIQKLRKF